MAQLGTVKFKIVTRVIDGVLCHVQVPVTKKRKAKFGNTTVLGPVARPLVLPPPPMLPSLWASVIR